MGDIFKKFTKIKSHHRSLSWWFGDHILDYVPTCYIQTSLLASEIILKEILTAGDCHLQIFQ